jgi:hypothetical protein
VNIAAAVQVTGAQQDPLRTSTPLFLHHAE